MVQWLGLCASTAGDMGSILDGELGSHKPWREARGGGGSHLHPIVLSMVLFSSSKFFDSFDFAPGYLSQLKIIYLLGTGVGSCFNTFH